MIHCFPPEYAIALNRDLTGQHHRVLNHGSLEGALARPLATYEARFLHESLLSRAAALLDGLVQAHAFFDGNKRTAWLLSIMYLEHHDVQVRDIAAEEVEQFVVGMVLHQHDVASGAAWFADRIA